MNKHLYRVIFNKARGLLMVVAENVSSDGKAGSCVAGSPMSSGSGAVSVTLDPLRFAFMLVLGLILPGVATAAIVADASAPAGQQPTVITTANGVLQVDIQTPSAAGVSRNTYSQFDVDNRGAILNNSRVDVQSQLGGWITGNQRLNDGTARIILNEVNSSAASHLNGYIEVAGDRAQVVIANPAGISCAGCGFINADRATLTTGAPIMNEGRLDGYTVSRGEVSIQGAGLDGRSTAYTDIIARSVRINAGIWANDLKITTGSNQVSADNTQSVPFASLGAKPEYAIDVAHLGGMYAGKIRLVGTEHGVGVRNAGTLAAESSNLVVTLDGRLENTGLLQGKQNIHLTTTGGVRNSGTLSAQRELLLTTTADLDNSAGRINAARLDISARSLKNRDGDLEQTGTQVLAIVAESLTNREAGRIGVAETPSGTGSGAGVGGTPAAPATGSTPPNTGENSGGGTPEPEHIEQLADGQLLIGELLDNDAGRILAGGKVTLATENLNNDQGRLGVHQLSVNGGEFSNRAGELTVTTAADITATRMRNDQGKLSVGGALALQAGELSNRDGKLIHSHTSSTALQVSGRFDNTGGLLATNADNLTVSADVLSNEDGRLEHVGTGAFSISATSLEGRAGSLLSNGALEITGRNTDLRAGTTSARRITIDTGTLTTAQGTLVATGDEALTLTAREALNNDGGTIATDGALSLHAGTLSNRDGLIAVSGGAASEIQVAGAVDNSAGVLTSSGALSLDAGDLLNVKGLVHTAEGSSVRLQVAGTLNNGSNGALVSGGSLILSSGQLDNHGGLIQAQGDAMLQAARADNTAGLILATQALDVTSQLLINHATLSDDAALGLQGQTVALKAHQLDNSGGSIAADQSLSLDGQGVNSTLINEGGKLTSSGSIELLVDNLRNAGGTVLAGVRNFIQAGTLTGAGRLLSHGDLSLKVSQDFVQTGEIVANGQADIVNDGRLTNQGSIEAGTLRVQAGDIDNTVTGEISGGNVQVSAASTLTNRGVIDGQKTRLDAVQVANIGTGRIYGDHLAIQAQTLINREETVGGVTQAGTIAARERLDLGVGTLINQEKALIFSAGSGDNALNIGGALDGNGHAMGRADSVRNASATIESLGGLSLASRYLLNSNEHFSTIEALTLKPTAITYIQPSGDANKYNISNFVWRSWSRAGYYAWKDDPAPSGTSVLGKSPIPRVGENDCSGEGDAEICVRLPGSDYLADDPAWAYFKLTAPDEEPVQPDAKDFKKKEEYEAALEAWSVAHAKWQTETDARYELLDARIETYNNQFDARKIKDWTQYKVTRTEYTTKVTASAPALIRSGGNMRLTGDELVNDKSRIVAGGALTGDLQSLKNIDAIGKHRVHEEGTAQDTWSRWRGGLKRYHQRRWGDLVSYRPADIVTRFNLDVVGVETNTQTAGAGHQIAAHSTTGVRDSLKGPSAVVPSLIGKLPQNSVEPSAAPEQVGPVGNVWDLPTSSLFKVSPGRGSFLVETDPRFTNQRTWLNSDYLLSQLSLDAAGMQQRIGDGFYEQWLIREQVSQLTGRRFLEGYGDDEAQYRALMEAGVTLAQDWNLRPGVALSAEQLARLTSDIVWLVEETVRLPDGTLATALVPKVYLVPRDGDLDGKGTLISAESIDLRLEGDLVNSGTIAGRSVVQLSGDNLRNLGGRISGEGVLMQARTDLENLGGRIDAQGSLLLSAGRDLTVASTTQSAYEQAGKSDFSRTNLDRVAGLYVSKPGGTLAVAAGRDVTLTGAEVVNAGSGGQTLISAGRNLTLATVQTSEQENIVADANNYLRMGETRELGTRVQTAGDLILTAGNDVNARAAQISSEAGAVLLNAGNDVNLTAGEETHNFSEAHKRKHSGMLGSTTTTSRYSEEESLALGTSVSGHTVQVQAGNDLTLVGSSVVSDLGTVLVAGNDVSILAAQNSYSQSHYEKEEKSGVMQSGAAVTVGKQMQSADSQQSGTYATASTVGSLGGDVTIQAGGDYRQVGSHVVAPGGDIAIRAKRVEIVEARETSHSANESKFRQSGVTAAVSSPVISALQTADQMKQASSRTDDRRLQALAAVTTGLSVSNAASAVGADPAALGGLNISVTAGSSKSDSRTETRSDTAAGSTVSAGGSVRIVASGAGQDSDLTIRGGAVTAGGDVLLKAEGDVALLAARNSSEMERESSSSSVGAGVAVNVGSNGASYGLTANASASKGDGESQDITWTHTQISAGNRLTLESGGDATLRGAVASGEQVVADIGGNLAIESLQDIHTFRSKDQSVGGSVTLGGGASASLNVGQQKIDSDYASVTEQSGIKAGDGGFDIRVEGNTDLKGAVIASNQSAIDAGLNRLDTGTLTHSDILNRAEYDATSLSLGFGYSSSGSGVGTDQQGNAQTGAEQTPGSTLPSNGSFSATTPVAMKAGDSDSSTTHSGISGGVLTIRDADGQGTLANLKRDVNSEQDGSNALKPIFDQQEIETAFEITKAFVQESGAFLQRKSAETADAEKKLKEEQEKPEGERNQARIAELEQIRDDNATWGMGGAGRLMLTALSAGASGNVTGGTGEMLQASAVNFAQGLAAQGVKLAAGDDDATRALLHGMVGCLGAAGQGGDCGSGALGGSGAVALNLLLDQMQGVNGSELTATEKEARSNLVASLLAGAAAASGGDAGTLGTAGRLETENNGAAVLPYALNGLAQLGPMMQRALPHLLGGAALGGAVANREELGEFVGVIFSPDSDVPIVLPQESVIAPDLPPSTTGKPIVDPEILITTSPAKDPQKADAIGGGYAVGGKPDVPNRTDGSPIVENGVIVLGTPAAEQLSAAVYNESSNGGDIANKELPEVKWSAQEKHFPGHNSYTPGRSILTSDPRKLAESAGSGAQAGEIPVGLPGSKERVNFGETIGTYIDRTGVEMPTSNGIIHYSKDGIHIVPSRP